LAGEFFLKRKIIFSLAYILVRLLYGSWRMVYLNEKTRDDAVIKSKRNSVVYACWHHSTLTSMLSVAFRKFAVLVSKSFDGEVIAYINRKFGIYSARGSSSKGGKDGLSELVSLVGEGYEIGFTVDGPRGPRHKVKAGVVALASKTGIPILPTASCGERFWVFYKSWDRFRLPKPFSKVFVIYGDPIWVEAELSREKFLSYQLKVEDALMELEKILKNTVGPRYAPFFDGK
jgi:lysophospholipid acyltransferase (LPLAT)-like uncharacterized protein